MIRRFISITDLIVQLAIYSAFWLVAIVHVSMRPTLFFGFIWVHSELIRDYYSILKGQTTEYGIWPGLLKSMGHDFLWIFIILATVIIPLSLIKRFINEKISIRKAALKYICSSVLSLVVSFIVGAVIVSIIATVLMSIGLFILGSPISPKLEIIIEIAASGIIITDLLFMLIIWTANMPDDPSSQGWRDFFNYKGLIALGIAIIAAVTISYSIDTRVSLHLPDHRETLHVYSYDSFNDRLLINDKRFPKTYRITYHKKNTREFTNEKKLYTDLSDTWKDIFIYAKDLPFMGYFKGLFHHRPDSITFDKDTMDIVLTYVTRHISQQPKYIYYLSKRPQYITRKIIAGGSKKHRHHYLMRDTSYFYSVSSKPAKSPNAHWGMVITQEKTRTLFLVTVKGNIIRFGGITSEGKPIYFYKEKMKSVAEKFMVKDEEYGYTIFINDIPKYYLGYNFSEIEIYCDSKIPISFSIQESRGLYTGKK